MLQIIVLICPMYLDRQHCDLSSAVDVIHGPRVSSAQQCGFMSQALLAPTALVPDPRKQFVKVVCPRQQVAGR